MKQFHIGIAVTLALVFSSAPVIGQSIYKWTDERGRIHFSNAPVKEAQSVDEELPPAANFGGTQDAASPSAEAPPAATQPSDASQPTAALPPDEGESEEVQDMENNDEANTPDQASTTTAEEPSTRTAEEAMNEGQAPEENELPPQEANDGESE